MRARAAWTTHPIGVEHYIAVVAAASAAADAPARVRALVQEPFFQWSLAGHARTVARAWCTNRKRALLSADGRALTVELFAKIADVNQMSAYSFIQVCATHSSVGCHAVCTARVLCFWFLLMCAHAYSGVFCPSLQAFGDLPKFEGATRATLLATLREMRGKLKPKKHESLYNQLSMMLEKEGNKK